MNIIKNNIKTQIEIKNSKFICNLIYVDNEDDVNLELEKIRKEHYDARHNCFAYVLGRNCNIKKQSDDGEPRGTAGIPILNVLENKKLTNCLAVVTRYFGGVLLGAGGLLRAYVDSTMESINNAEIIEVYEGVSFHIDTDYQHFGSIEKLIESFDNVHLVKSSFLENIKLEYICTEDGFDDLKNKLINITNGKIDIEVVENLYYSIFDNKTKIIKLI